MSKFIARLRVKNAKQVAHLIKAFFDECEAPTIFDEGESQTSSITIKNNEAILSIDTNMKPCEKIIDAICQCEVLAFQSGDYSKIEDAIRKMNREVEEVKQKSPVIAESNTDVHLAKNKKAKSSTKAVLHQDDEEKKIVDYNKDGKADVTWELDKIAEKATSFEHFAKLVAEWLEMDRRTEFFTNLIIVSAEVDTIVWKKLEEALHKRNVKYIPYDKTWTRTQILKKFPLMNTIKFLEIIKEKYKEYPFKPTDIPVKSQETLEKSEENKSSNAGAEAFKKRMSEIDKTQPIEERIRYVLEKMGLKNLSEIEQEQILEIANVAVKEKNITEDIFNKVNIQEKEISSARMTFIELVKAFWKSTLKSKERIKLLTFLSILQDVVMLEDEI